jgi:adenylate kinase family enzyme
MPRRIHIMGTSGSGKSHLGHQLASALSIPHVELDALYHGPDWTAAAPDRFREDVAQVAAGDAWVVDGNYAAAREVLWERAQLVIFLDRPRWRVMAQLARRSLSRSLRGTTLWNGNREHLRNLLRTDPSENVLLWSWLRYAPDRVEFDMAAANPRWAAARQARIGGTRD